MIDLDWTIAIQFAVIMLFIAIMSRLVFNPFLKLIERRERSIEGAAHDSEKMLRDLAEKEAEMHLTIESVKKQAMNERQQILNQTREQERQLIEQARLDSVRLADESRARLTVAVERTSAELKTHTESFARLITDRVLRREANVNRVNGQS